MDQIDKFRQNSRIKNFDFARMKCRLASMTIFICNHKVVFYEKQSIFMTKQ